MSKESGRTKPVTQDPGHGGPCRPGEDGDGRPSRGFEQEDKQSRFWRHRSKYFGNSRMRVVSVDRRPIVRLLKHFRFRLRCEWRR